MKKINDNLFPVFDIGESKRFFILLVLFLAWFSAGFLLRNHAMWYKAIRFYYHAGVLLAACLLIWIYPEKDFLPKDRFAFSRRGRRRYTVLLIVLMLLAVSGHYNMGRFHGNNYAHYHEVIHYYLGSKYFPELGYSDLYNAFLAADRETGHKFRHISIIRDLGSKELVKVSDVEAQIRAIPEKFTPERWRAFKAELQFFRDKRSFKKLMLDHGYNPSPVWTVEGRAMSAFFSLFALTQKQMVRAIVWVDPLLLSLTFVMIWVAFGFKMMAFSLIFWGANPLVLYDYTGGAFMRQNWLASLIIGICLFKKNKSVAAGVFMANSIGVRLFPAVFMLLPAFHFAYGWIKGKKASMRLLLFGCSTVVSFLALFFLSLNFAGGLGSWATFLKNATEHNKGVYTNHISYRNLFIYEKNRNANSYKSTGAYHHERWRLDKEERVAGLKPLIHISLLLLLGITAFLFRDDRPEKGIYMAAFFPFLLFYPANYYAMYLLPLVFLAGGDKRMLLTLFSTLVLCFMLTGIRPFDVYNIAISLLLLFLMAHVMVRQGDRAGRGAL